MKKKWKYREGNFNGTVEITRKQEWGRDVLLLSNGKVLTGSSRWDKKTKDWTVFFEGKWIPWQKVAKMVLKAFSAEELKQFRWKLVDDIGCDRCENIWTNSRLRSHSHL